MRFRPVGCRTAVPFWTNQMVTDAIRAVDTHVDTYKDIVALYFHRLGGLGGGAERMICLLADALVARGFVVHMLSWDDPQAESFYPFSTEVKWHRLGFRAGAADKLRRAS